MIRALHQGGEAMASGSWGPVLSGQQALTVSRSKNWVSSALTASKLPAQLLTRQVVHSKTCTDIMGWW